MDSSLRPARLGLIGGECTGKSTLARELAHHLDAALVTEYLREFVDAHGRTPRRDEQASIMQAQRAREDAAAAPGTLVVADPAVLMTAVYSIVYFDDDSLVDEAVRLAGHYDLLAWCDVDLPWEPDGTQRDGPEYRLREHAVIGELVAARLTPAGIDVVLVSGPPGARLEAVRRAWQPEPLQPPT